MVFGILTIIFFFNGGLMVPPVDPPPLFVCVIGYILSWVGGNGGEFFKALCLEKYYQHHKYFPWVTPWVILLENFGLVSIAYWMTDLHFL